MTQKERKAMKKRVKEIQTEIKEITHIFQNNLEWIDGEKLLDNEFHDIVWNLRDELEEIENVMEA